MSLMSWGSAVGWKAAPLVIVLAACTPSSLPTDPAPPSADSARSSAIACGTPSPRIDDPKGATAPGNRLGPLLIVSGFAASGSPAPTPVGAPTKVLISVIEPLAKPVTLSGARCSDGQPLRFWYLGGSRILLRHSSSPVPEQALAQTGELTLTVASDSYHTGYMLFTTHGPWRLRAQSDGRDLGEIIILVGAR